MTASKTARKSTPFQHRGIHSLEKSMTFSAKSIVKGMTKCVPYSHTLDTLADRSQTGIALRRLPAGHADSEKPLAERNVGRKHAKSHFPQSHANREGFSIFRDLRPAKCPSPNFRTGVGLITRNVR